MSFERDGFCVLRGWLPAAAVDALRGDLRRARAQLKITDAALEAADLNVDFMGRAFGGRLGAASPAGARPGPTRRRARGDGRRRRRRRRRERAVLGQLAAAAAEHAGYGSVYLLSEVFVVKPAGSGTEFAWHRDDAKQLAKLGGEAAPDRFCSTVFRSPKGAFCLDGTKHPDALLTQSMARDDTLAALIRGAGVCGEGDAAAGASARDARGGARGAPRCAVLDDLDDARWAALGLPACPLEPARRRRSRQLFVSRGATTTQVHRDAYDNVYVCLRGERNWRLAHADHGPYVERSPGSVSAAADGALRRRVAFGEVALAPGHALFVPRHAVAAADDGGLSAAAAWYLDDGD
ncbi:phytanoyl-CoA dioxygenase [Aureococcus anophagefferens]|nr:phytanoyl-CoA dioxygenase [Aureococcus anophagefferens]